MPWTPARATLGSFVAALTLQRGSALARGVWSDPPDRHHAYERVRRDRDGDRSADDTGRGDRRRGD